MTTTLENLEPTVVKVQQEPSVIPTKIGTPEFETALLSEFSGKHAWRSSANLAQKLKVDIKELEVFLDKNKNFLRRLGDKDSVLYAVAKRVSEDTSESTKTQLKQVSIRPQDRYALASINLLADSLETVLKKHALSIHECDEESLSHLTKSLKHLKSATVLLAQATKANPEHLI